MNNKSDREILIPIIAELELAIDEITQKKQRFSPQEITNLNTALSLLKDVLGKAFAKTYSYKRNKYLSIKEIDELIVLICETDNKYAKIEKDGNIENNKEDKPSEAYKRMHAAININSLIQMKHALIAEFNNAITIKEIPDNNGKIFRKIYKKNKIEYRLMFDTLVKKFHSISDDDNYSGKFNEKLENILCGKRKNIDSDLWNDMLECLLYLSNTDENNPQQYFYSQYISYILKQMEDLETYTLPDFDGAIAEYDQKKKQEQSGN